MPALWQASQRPMYIRTVWVDGFRHAILNHDDPHYIELNAKRRRPHSSASVNPKRKAQSSRLSQHRDSDSCLRKLDLIIKSDRIRIASEPEIEKLNLIEVEQSEEEFVLKASPVPLCEFDSYQSRDIIANMKTIKSNRTARTEVQEDNDLSDRVLQWLDLAGKVDLLPAHNTERITQPRHSCPDIQRRNMNKSRTVTDLRMKEGKPTSAKSKSCYVIDRQEFYVPTSATTIENYARQSRNMKSTPHETQTKIKENKKLKNTRVNMIETRQKVANERSEVKKQYAELVSKKIVPESTNTKKQVHIFIPEAITKKLSSETTSRTESLLSQKT